VPIYVWLPLSLLAAFYLGLCLGLLTRSLALAASRHPRHGGDTKQPASPGQRAVTAFPQSTTVTMGYFSLPLLPGGASEAWVGRRMLRDPSRLTGRGWSIVGTEALGANGAPPKDAA